jgi:ATP-dependent Clp protease ATP-binding subunit ClpA
MNDFTPRAQQVLVLARKEAERFNHNYVGTEHLLLGLIKLGQGVAVNVLQKMGLDLETVRLEVEKHVGPHPETKMVGNMPQTAELRSSAVLTNSRTSWLPTISACGPAASLVVGHALAVDGRALPRTIRGWRSRQSPSPFGV